MAINQKQVLSLQQKLSPQQIQMIKLLELPTVQLEQRIKQEIEDNIVLEEEDRKTEDEEQQPQEISVDEYLREDDTPSYKSRINNYSKDDKQRPVYLTEGRSLQEYLVEQLGYRNLSEREMRLAVYLIGSIDEDGYLRRDLESVADDIAFTEGIETSVAELERLLGIIHELEPAGIGARNLQECLLLQMDQQPLDKRARRLARRILTSHFEEFVKKHYEKLIARLQVSEEDFREAIAEIRRLSPKPGNLYAEGGTDTTPYIIPDFILDYQDGHFQLSLNSYNVPEVRINRRYVEMIRDMVGTDGKVREKDRGGAVRQEQDRLGQVVHLGHQAAPRHAHAHDADDSGLPAGVLQGRRQVEAAADDPQGHRRPHGARRLDDLACGEQQVRADAVRHHPAQVALLGGDADRFGRGGVELRDQEHPAGVHRRGRQAPSADGRDAHGHPQFEGIPHCAAHGRQVPRDARHPRGAPAQANLTMKLYRKIAHGLSWALHPFVLPLYMIVVLLTLTVFAHYSPGVKCYLLWVVILYAIVIPALSLGVLRSLGRISSYRVDDRRVAPRSLPLWGGGRGGRRRAPLRSPRYPRRLFCASSCSRRPAAR